MSKTSEDSLLVTRGKSGGGEAAYCGDPKKRSTEIDISFREIFVCVVLEFYSTTCIRSIPPYRTSL